MSDLPPGVSGREPQITGYDESEEPVLCLEPGPLLVLTADAAEEVRSLRRQVERSRNLGSILDVLGEPGARSALREQQILDLAELLEAAPVVEASCPFAGIVTVRSHPDTGAWWECPVCGRTQEWGTDERI